MANDVLVGDAHRRPSCVGLNLRWGELTIVEQRDDVGLEVKALVDARDELQSIPSLRD